MKKIIVILLALQLSAFHTLISTACQLEIAKEATRAYYEDGEYERELESIVVAVHSRFQQPAAHSKQAVIIDVDDTALSAYQFFKEHDFGCVWNTWCNFLHKHNLPAIPHVQRLFHHFKSLGYKIIFLTSRAGTFHEATMRNLIAVGYTDFEQLITRDTKYTHMKGTQFKEQARKALVSEGYEIVCCIDDLASNLTGEHLGHAVKIPNMLYS